MKLLKRLAAGGIILWLAALAWLAWSADQAIRHNPQVSRAGVALVLGNAVNKNGRPNPCLRSRVAAAAELYHSGRADRLIMSGGDDGDGSNEAVEMKKLAVTMGVPADKIATEERSESTLENLRFSRPLMQGATRITLVSSAFHLKRAAWIAEHELPAGFTVQSYAGAYCDAQAKTYIWKLIRETLAFAKTAALDILLKSHPSH